MKPGTLVIQSHRPFFCRFPIYVYERCDSSNTRCFATVLNYAKTPGRQSADLSEHSPTGMESTSDPVHGPIEITISTYATHVLEREATGIRSDRHVGAQSGRYRGARLERASERCLWRCRWVIDSSVGIVDVACHREHLRQTRGSRVMQMTAAGRFKASVDVEASCLAVLGRRYIIAQRSGTYLGALSKNPLGIGAMTILEGYQIQAFRRVALHSRPRP